MEGIVLSVSMMYVQLAAIAMKARVPGVSGYEAG